MRVFMLGWEFPPFISGGLGTACLGLTRGLHRQGVRIAFVLPRPVQQRMHQQHSDLPVRLLPPAISPTFSAFSKSPAWHGVRMPASDPTALPAGELPRVTFHVLPASLLNPYQRQLHQRVGDLPGSVAGGEPTSEAGRGDITTVTDPGQGGVVYVGDLLAEARRYADLCVKLGQRERFDVIHAHDWLTFPAGLAVAAASGKPLVVHVHSTEFDRSGQQASMAICEIERQGLQGADQIIAVSHRTRQLIHDRYCIDPARIQVVYNGIDPLPPGETPSRSATPAIIEPGERVVLFLGRITMQKGPEYFVAAAKQVLAKMDRVKFVMAGTGDMVGRIIELAAREGIGQKILFTGFLQGPDVDRVLNMADVYVMPSVSEPFGITPLEAIRHDVPVIISRTSGVSEVLRHALKVDFWDTQDIANKILAVLRHPPLGRTLRQHADLEIRALTWDQAAERCVKIYQQAITAKSESR